MVALSVQFTTRAVEGHMPFDKIGMSHFVDRLGVELAYLRGGGP